MYNSRFALLTLILLTTPVLAAPDHGDTRETSGKLEVWHGDMQAWISPERLFAVEMRRLKGPTYGTTHQYPPYDSVKEWETLIDQLPDGRTCPMVFFHGRWRRLPDVLALDEVLRNYEGCGDVLKF